MTDPQTADQYELPSAFETEPDSEEIPEVAVLEDSNAVDADTGKTVHPNAMPTNMVDPYNLRYKPNPAIQFENYVPFPNHTGDTLAEDASLNPLRNAGLTADITQDSDQPQTPEEALQILPVEEQEEITPTNEDYESGANGTDLESEPGTPVPNDNETETEAPFDNSETGGDAGIETEIDPESESPVIREPEEESEPVDPFA